MNAVVAYLWNIIIWIDQGANVILAPLLNMLLHKDSPHRFGDSDESLSSVFGKNVEFGGCYGCRLMCRFLSAIDHRHCERNIERDEG